MDHPTQRIETHLVFAHASAALPTIDNYLIGVWQIMAEKNRNYYLKMFCKYPDAWLSTYAIWPITNTSWNTACTRPLPRSTNLPLEKSREDIWSMGFSPSGIRRKRVNPARCFTMRASNGAWICLTIRLTPFRGLNFTAVEPALCSGF